VFRKTPAKVRKLSPKSGLRDERPLTVFGRAFRRIPIQPRR
jgi:hypothetical protein